MKEFLKDSTYLDIFQKSSYDLLEKLECYKLKANIIGLNIKLDRFDDLYLPIRQSFDRFENFIANGLKDLLKIILAQLRASKVLQLRSLNNIIMQTRRMQKLTEYQPLFKYRRFENDQIKLKAIMAEYWNMTVDQKETNMERLLKDVFEIRKLVVAQENMEISELDSSLDDNKNQEYYNADFPSLDYLCTIEFKKFLKGVEFKKEMCEKNHIRAITDMIENIKTYNNYIFSHEYRTSRIYKDTDPKSMQLVPAIKKVVEPPPVIKNRQKESRTKKASIKNVPKMNNVKFNACVTFNNNEAFFQLDRGKQYVLNRSGYTTEEICEDIKKGNIPKKLASKNPNTIYFVDDGPTGIDQIDQYLFKARILKQEGLKKDEQAKAIEDAKKMNQLIQARKMRLNRIKDERLWGNKDLWRKHVSQKLKPESKTNHGFKGAINENLTTRTNRFPDNQMKFKDVKSFSESANRSKLMIKNEAFFDNFDDQGQAVQINAGEKKKLVQRPAEVKIQQVVNSLPNNQAVNSVKKSEAITSNSLQSQKQKQNKKKAIPWKTSSSQNSKVVDEQKNQSISQSSIKLQGSFKFSTNQKIQPHKVNSSIQQQEKNQIAKPKIPWKKSTSNSILLVQNQQANKNQKKEEKNPIQIIKKVDVEHSESNQLTEQELKAILMKSYPLDPDKIYQRFCEHFDIQDSNFNSNNSFIYRYGMRISTKYLNSYLEQSQNKIREFFSWMLKERMFLNDPKLDEDYLYKGHEIVVVPAFENGIFQVEQPIKTKLQQFRISIVKACQCFEKVSKVIIYGDDVVELVKENVHKQKFVNIRYHYFKDIDEELSSFCKQQVSKHMKGYILRLKNIQMESKSKSPTEYLRLGLIMKLCQLQKEQKQEDIINVIHQKMLLPIYKYGHMIPDAKEENPH